MHVRILAALISAASFLVPAAEAKPVAMMCRGSSTYEDKNTLVAWQGSAILDLENYSFSLSTPIADFVISYIGDTVINFGRRDEGSLSLGTIDRISGELILSTLPSRDQVKQQDHQWLVIARCNPASKLF
ncbi:hypothetical protein [Bradyrhizobium sp. Ai1a-2]|uniref:hypothetical protein n=1 Tax=Bradyrhizobium sp. Ai1a-2 TaxID=196490 RepID=UPI000484575A|nr:hypothetical protein [Bradyrhizobium sp. Ai1a-2]